MKYSTSGPLPDRDGEDSKDEEAGQSIEELVSCSVITESKLKYNMPLSAAVDLDS